MAQQEEGWPLGLQPLNVRVGLARSRNFSGSTSFNTILSGSPSSSTNSSSDLDTESTGSFFHDRSTTLGSLIGVARIVNLSRRSTRGTSNPEAINGGHKSYRTKTWCFSLCPTDTTDAETVARNTPSLGHFLAVERRAAANEHHRSSHSSVFCGPDELAMAQPDREPNTLFVNGQIAPPPHESSSSPWSGSDVHRRNTSGGLGQGSGQGVPVLLFPCMCGCG
ncbi:uncharacterized protein At3g17950-like [Coffea eugenioides]|uniref:Uncharacterized protein n=1 Tax=Coffea arabica TaxID=13443 RepID=A0A6P6UA31_COFAR|nr:uncharacterized protein At3g17950-like [Coffea arabica]XP_027180509.1 uncharacterized protein At3g17950-like [Coffea eugenioides]